MRHSRNSSREGTLCLLELTASESPELVLFAIQNLSRSPAGFSLVQIAKAWGVDLAGLPLAAKQAAADLDYLEGYRRVWRRLDGVFQHPTNSVAIADFATVRRWRVEGVPRRARLERIARRCLISYREAQRVRWLHDFLGFDLNGDGDKAATKASQPSAPALP